MRASDLIPCGSTAPFHASQPYRLYVVWLLFLVYTCNFLDRQILSIVMEPIRREFGLHDWHLGLLSGFAFAVVYTTLGLPIARLADRRNRVRIISWSIAAWSIFTVLTGMARNFGHLLTMRIGVGIGEAGCSPAAYSLISDYFDRRRRTTALSIYSMGVYAGGAAGFLVGGLVAHTYGWRAAFYAAGIPGLVLAVIVRLTIKEPPRGFSEDVQIRTVPSRPWTSVLSDLWRCRSFRHLSLAAGLHTFAAYGVNTFHAPFFMRSHGMSLGELSGWLASITAIGGLAGSYVSGRLCDRGFQLSQDSRWYLWIPAAALAMNVIVGQVAYALQDRHLALWCLLPYIALSAAYLGPSIAATHQLVSVRERALASAILLFILNFIGLGLGPVFTGAVSDLVHQWLLNHGVAASQALADGLRMAIRLTVLVNLWAAVHYVIAARTLRNDVHVQQLRAPATEA